MKFEFKPSFDRSIKHLKVRDKEDLKRTAILLLDILAHRRALSEGIGLKRLKSNFWEVREGLRARILFRWEGDLVEFILVGDHNDIKRYLRSN